MNNSEMTESLQPRVNYDQVRPITNKDLMELEPEVQSYVQAHSYGIDLETNQFI